MDPLLSINYATIASFFEATQGNFRNAVYVSCSCSYIRESGCGDFLFIPGHDCCPLIFPVKDAQYFLGIKIDKSEFSLTMNSLTFIRLYNRWITLITASDEVCPIQQLLHFENQLESSK